MSRNQDNTKKKVTWDEIVAFDKSIKDRKDPGEDLSIDDIAKLFDLFNRLDERTRPRDMRFPIGTQGDVELKANRWRDIPVVWRATENSESEFQSVIEDTEVVLKLNDIKDWYHPVTVMFDGYQIDMENLPKTWTLPIDS